MNLTQKQRAFIEAYTGNATKAAVIAGYSVKTACSQGQRLLKNPDVAASIRTRENKRQLDTIAKREERLMFYTKIMRDENEEMKNRLRAAELLGKAEGDFLERVTVENQKNLDIRGEVRLRLLELEKERREQEQIAAIQAEQKAV